MRGEPVYLYLKLDFDDAKRLISVLSSVDTPEAEWALMRTYEAITESCEQELNFVMRFGHIMYPWYARYRTVSEVEAEAEVAQSKEAFREAFQNELLDFARRREASRPN